MDFLGDPGSIDHVATGLTAAHGTLARTQGEVTAAVSALVPGSWNGSAASAFQGHWGTEGTSIDALAGVASRMAGVLTALATQLRHAQAVAQQAQGVASSQGLTISAAGQVGPSLLTAPLGLPPNPVQLQAQQQAQTRAQGLMDQARSIAHDAQTRAMGQLAGLSVPQVEPGVTAQQAMLWAQGSVAGQPGAPTSFGTDLWKALSGNGIPPGGQGDLALGLWAFGRGLKLAGTTSTWMSKVVLGRFAPRDALGRFVSPSQMSLWDRAMASTDGKNWIAKPFAADSRAAWSTAGKWIGRGGLVIGAVASGLGQWMQDARNPNLNTDQRVSRAAYRSVVSTAGAWAGGTAGAEVGAEIGSLAGPVGTVVGGLVGGIAGGVIGSGVGNWVVDHTVNAVGHAGGVAIHAVGDAGSTVVHGAEHLLDDINPF